MRLHRIGFSAILKQTNTSDLFFLMHPKLSCIHLLIFTQTLLTLIQDRQILIAEFWSLPLHLQEQVGEYKTSLRKHAHRRPKHLLKFSPDMEQLKPS